MNKKQYFILTIITILLLTSIPTASAADFEIINNDYSVNKSKSDATKQYYTIFITIQNTKTTPFKNLTIEILDEWDLPTRQTITFQPQESKTLTFEEIPFAGGNTHQVTVNFYPQDENKRSPATMGNTTFTVSYNSQTSSETPFLHPFVTFSMLVLIAIVVKKQRQK